MRVRVALAAGLAALAAGCGDDGGEGATTAERAAYIARADALCASFDTRAKPLQARLNALRGSDQATQRREAPPLIRQVAAVSRDLLARLRALPLPPDGAGATAVYDAGQAGIGTLERVADAIEAGDLARAASLNAQLGAATARQRAAARAFGFRECGSGD